MRYVDVPELVQLIKFVRSRPDLYERICNFQEGLPRHDEATKQAALRFEEYEISQLPLEMLDRAHALEKFDDASTLSFYLELEKARLEPTLETELVVPLLLTSFDLDEALELDDEVLLAPLGADQQLARVTQASSISGVPEPLISAATHAIVVKNQSVDNSSIFQRVWRGRLGPVSLKTVDLVCQAITICTTRETGYSQVLVRPIGWADGWNHDLPPLKETLVLRRYPEHFDNYGWLSERRAIAAGDYSALPETFKRLRAAAAKTKLAARRLFMARTRHNDEEKIIDACIGLEALLGEGRDELSHRMALRAATVLAARVRNPMDAHIAYKLTKVVYDYRSSIVHGGTDNKKATAMFGEKEYRTVDLSVLLLRELLMDQLSGSNGGWTPLDLDDRLFTALNTDTNREDE